MIPKNKSTRFLLPSLNISRKDIIETDFINVYIGHEEYQKEFKFPILFLAFEKRPENENVYTNCLDQYEIDNKYIIVHKIEEKFIEDFYNFMNGKYSKISKELTKRIKDFSGEKSDEYMTIIKHKDRKLWLENRIDEKLPNSFELMSILKEDEEILKTPILTIC